MFISPPLKFDWVFNWGRFVASTCERHLSGASQQFNLVDLGRIKIKLKKEILQNTSQS